MGAVNPLTGKQEPRTLSAKDLGGFDYENTDPFNPFAFTGGMYSADIAASFTARLAALRENYTSQLAAQKGQRTNLQAAFRQTKSQLKAQGVSNLVAAEGQAVERGVLGGSADVKNRISVASKTVADIVAARLEKQQAIADTYQAALQVGTDYKVGLASVEMDRSNAITAATINAMATGQLDTSKLKSVPTNGVLADVALGIGQTQVGVATYKFGTANPGKTFDCSGFTSWVFEQATGMTLAHNANQQMNDSRLAPVPFSQLQKGDLVFFWYPNDRGIPPTGASHVGIYMGNGQVMDASLSGNTIMTRAIDWSALIGARRVPWSVLPTFGGGK